MATLATGPFKIPGVSYDNDFGYVALHPLIGDAFLDSTELGNIFGVALKLRKSVCGRFLEFLVPITDLSPSQADRPSFSLSVLKKKAEGSNQGGSSARKGSLRRAPGDRR